MLDMLGHVIRVDDDVVDVNDDWLPLDGERRMSRVCWNIDGAFVNPKGIRVYRKVPHCDVDAVFGLSTASTGTCQYPELQSRVVKTLALPSESIHSSILGSGYVSVWCRR